MKFLKESWFPLLLGLAVVMVSIFETLSAESGKHNHFVLNTNSADWVAPDINSVPKNEEGQLILYGRDLVVNTSLYLGPKGKVASISNGLDCQNCHLDADAKPFGNSFAAVP
ncbi:MAG: hypothetical protein C4308_13060 [Chitinophagaceae bacterium]